MNNKAFKRYIFKLVTLLYPDAADIPGKRVMIKIDSDPGRIKIDMLLYLKLIGVYLYPTVSNAIAVQQETDQNYGLFESLIQVNLKLLLSEVKK